MTLLERRSKELEELKQTIKENDLIIKEKDLIIEEYKSIFREFYKLTRKEGYTDEETITKISLDFNKSKEEINGLLWD